MQGTYDEDRGNYNIRSNNYLYITSILTLESTILYINIFKIKSIFFYNLLFILLLSKNNF